MAKFTTEKLRDQFSNSLGLVFWVEAPAIGLLTTLFAYMLWLFLDSLGVPHTGMLVAFYLVIGFGVFLVCSYIWLVSKNTSSQIFSWLARLYVIILAIVYAAFFVLLLL